MRLLLLFCLTLFVAALGFGQHQKGEVLLDGGSRLSSNHPGDDYLLKGGLFFTDRLLVGAALRYDPEQLVNTFDRGVLRGDLFARYYLGRKNARLQPYLELGIGGLTNSGTFLSLTPTVGLESRLLPGVYGRAALSYEYTAWGDVYTFELGSSLALNFGGGATELPALRKGNLLVNSNFGSLSLASHDGIYNKLSGQLRLDASYLITDALAVNVNADFQRTNLDFTRQDQVVDYTAFTAGADLRYFFPPRSQTLQPYAGLGAQYLSIKREASDPQFGYGDEARTFSPYVTLGGYLHLSDRVSLNLQYIHRMGKLPNGTPRRELQLGTVLRFGK